MQHLLQDSRFPNRDFLGLFSHFSEPSEVILSFKLKGHFRAALSKGITEQQRFHSHSIPSLRDWWIGGDTKGAKVSKSKRPVLD